MFPMRQLDIYLSDHLAGATVGVELARRAAKSNRGTPTGEFLESLHREISEDRRTLVAVARALKPTRRPPSQHSHGPPRRRPGSS
jgi:N-acetylglucosamine kinase-like BadF-type ATPase